MTRTRTIVVCLLLATGAALTACGDSADAEQARDGLRVAMETLRGDPSAERLAEATPFIGGGVAFDHPKPLRTAFEQSPEGNVWTFAYGTYELELWANEGGPAAAEYLQNIADVLVEDEGASLRKPVSQDRVVEVCGQAREVHVMEVNLFGEPYRYEAIDLLPDHRGRNRILMQFDSRLGGGASRVATATNDMVLSSLRCLRVGADPADAEEFDDTGESGESSETGGDGTQET